MKGLRSRLSGGCCEGCHLGTARDKSYGKIAWSCVWNDIIFFFADSYIFLDFYYYFMRVFVTVKFLYAKNELLVAKKQSLFIS